MNHFYHVGPTLEKDTLLESLKSDRSISFQSYQKNVFEDGNCLLEISETDSPPDHVYVSFLSHDHAAELLVELGLLVNTLKRKYACPITCFIRYLGYSRGNRINKKNISLGAKVYTTLLCTLDIDRFFVFDLHASELVGFFSKPIAQVSSLPLFIQHFQSNTPPFDYVVSPDCGRVDDCYYLASQLDTNVDFFPKRRQNHDGSSEIITHDRPHFNGKKILLFDDEVNSGLTLLHAIENILLNGASEIHIAAIYSFFDPSLLKQLQSFPQVRSFTTTNLGTPPACPNEKNGFYHIINCNTLFDTTRG